MSVLVIGRAGQVAQSLIEKAVARGIALEAVGRPELDLERPGDAARLIERKWPSLIINAAAYTAVDRAEGEQERVFRINAEAAGEIAAAAADVDAPLIHLSTDYVFDGSIEGALDETFATAPANAYGRSKLAGEEAVRRAQSDHVIARTAWLYGPFGSNFARTMLRLAAEREELAVVDDQVGSPTSTLDVADCLLDVAERRLGGDRCGFGQTYHLSAGGRASWAEFARAIFALSAERGGPSARVRPISSSDYPTPAKRPANSLLDSRRFAASFGAAPREWRDALSEVIVRLVPRPFLQFEAEG